MTAEEERLKKRLDDEMRISNGMRKRIESMTAAVKDARAQLAGYEKKLKASRESVDDIQARAARAFEAVREWSESTYESEYDGRTLTFRLCCDVSMSPEENPHAPDCPAITALKYDNPTWLKAKQNEAVRPWLVGVNDMREKVARLTEATAALFDMAEKRRGS